MISSESTPKNHTFWNKFLFLFKNMKNNQIFAQKTRKIVKPLRLSIFLILSFSSTEILCFSKKQNQFSILFSNPHSLFLFPPHLPERHPQMAEKQNNPNDFIKELTGRPVVVKVNSGVCYHGIFPSTPLDRYNRYPGLHRRFHEHRPRADSRVCRWRVKSKLRWLFHSRKQWYVVLWVE